MRMKSGSNKFLLQLLEMQDYVPLNTGTAQPKLNAEVVKKMALRFPADGEQELIGELFRLLDEIIALQKRKLGAVSALKISLLGKMLSPSGRSIPTIRFRGFSTSWGANELAEIFTKGGSGGTPSSTNSSYYGGEIPFMGISDITNSNGFIKSTEKHITEDGLANSAAWIVPAGAISLAMYASVGKIAILQIDASTSQAFYNMVFEDDTVRDFVYHRLVFANQRSDWQSLISTGTQANLNAEKVKSFSISVPGERPEIDKIAKILNLIDDIARNQAARIEQLKDLKTALLHQMFV